MMDTLYDFASGIANSVANGIKYSLEPFAYLALVANHYLFPDPFQNQIIPQNPVPNHLDYYFLDYYTIIFNRLTDLIIEIQEERRRNRRLFLFFLFPAVLSAVFFGYYKLIYDNKNWEFDKQNQKLVDNFQYQLINLFELRKNDFAKNFSLLFNVSDKKLFENSIFNIQLVSDKEMGEYINSNFLIFLDKVGKENNSQNNFKNIFPNMNKFNIVVQGPTGSGKSTLINSVLKENISTGIGLPHTQETVLYEKPDNSFRIYDTKGIEHKDYDYYTALEATINLINQNNKSGNPNNFIHCIWFCFNVETKRFEEGDIDYVLKLKNTYDGGELPIIIVLTQIVDDFSTKDFKDKLLHELNEKNITDVEIVETLAKEKTINFRNSSITIPSFGLTNLLNVSFEKSKMAVKSAYYTYFHQLSLKAFNEKVMNISKRINPFSEQNDIKKNLYKNKKLDIVAEYFEKILNDTLIQFMLNRTNSEKYKEINAKALKCFLAEFKNWTQLNLQNFYDESEERLNSYLPVLIEKGNFEDYLRKIDEISKEFMHNLKIDTNIVLFERLFEIYKNVLYEKISSNFDKSWNSSRQEINKRIDSAINRNLEKIKLLAYSQAYD